MEVTHDGAVKVILIDGCGGYRIPYESDDAKYGCRGL